MTENANLPTDIYLSTLQAYYEEEISGERYFYGLAEYFSETEKTRLLARVEREAANSILPLLEKYNLIARSEFELEKIGNSHINMHKDYSWWQFMDYIIRRYPAYLDEFYNLEAMAPAEDLPAVQRLTKHEILVIDFARRELADDPDSLNLLRDYIATSNPINFNNKHSQG